MATPIPISAKTARVHAQTVTGRHWRETADPARRERASSRPGRACQKHSYSRAATPLPVDNPVAFAPPRQQAPL